MGGMKINFAEVEGSFDPLPEGQYECIIERVEVRESKSSDNDYLNWELNVQDEDHEGRKLWMITSLSERALFRLKDVLVELGVIEEDDELDFQWEDDVDITPTEGPLLTNPELDGLACVAVVTNEVYEGRERNRVNELLGSGAGSGGSSKKKSSSSSKKSSSSSSSKKSSGGSGGRRRKMR